MTTEVPGYALAVDQLAKSYDGHLVLNEVSFVMSEGESVALLGRNGAGKSTTMNIITGTTDAKQGSVRVFGHDVRSQRTAAQRVLGYLPQQTAVYPTLTVLENAEVFGGIRGLNASTARRRCDELLEELAINELRGQRCGSLSEGQRRLVNLACVLLHEPKLAILDEPTAGVDVTHRQSMAACVSRLRDAGTCVLLTTHFFEEASALCDRVLLLHGGTLTVDQPMQRFMANQGTPRVSVTFDRPVSDEDLALMGREIATSIERLDRRSIAVAATDGRGALPRIVGACGLLDASISAVVWGSRNLEEAFLRELSILPTGGRDAL